MADNWILTEEMLNEAGTGEKESLFSLGNGYLGFRGFPADRCGAWFPGIFINGFYETVPIHYGEKGYGFPDANQVIVPLPDSRFLDIQVGTGLSAVHFGDTDSGELLSSEIRLDLHAGVLSREIYWEAAAGDRLRVTWTEFISTTLQHVGGIRLQIVRETGDSPITLIAAIADPLTPERDREDPRSSAVRDPLLLALSGTTTLSADSRQAESSLLCRTTSSGLSLMCGYVLECRKGSAGDAVTRTAVSHGAESILMTFYPEDGGGSAIVMEKLFCYVTGTAEGESSLRSQYRDILQQAVRIGYDGLLAQHTKNWKGFWEHADITVAGDDRLQLALRYNIFQLNQSVGKDGLRGLAAKGLSGNGYDGHYFWDTEVYAMPIYTNTQPETARQLLKFRIQMLDAARERAAELAEYGALYPWRTINGHEASAYFPAGTAQYHINADIAYSLVTYVEITGDVDILFEGGAEMLFETARLWISLGYLNEAGGQRFCINEVTGPDEYTALVNNNFYTNVMAAYHLTQAHRWYGYLAGKHAGFLEALSLSIALTQDEVERWRSAAESIYLPYDTALGINLQDDAFLDREPWPESGAKHGSPHLLHFHPLVIYRHRIIKQVDAVLIHFLLPEYCSHPQQKRDYDFYRQYTVGDSSLSACIEGILALRFGYRQEADSYFRRTLNVDLDNLHANTRDGLHVAAMAGSWLFAVYGYAGLYYENGTPCFYPRGCMEGAESYSFSILAGNVRLFVEIAHEYTTYFCRRAGKDNSGGEQTLSLGIKHRGHPLTVGRDPLRVPSGPELKGVVFDLDGVITSTDEYHYLAWKLIADRRGWIFNREINQRLRGVSRRESLLVITRENGADVNEEEIGELTAIKNRAYRQMLENLTEEDILPGVLELINELTAAGIPIALASASRNAPYIIEKLKIAELIDYVVPAEEVAYGKPDPEIFCLAAEGIGCRPDECVGFEDAKAGVKAIRAANMVCVGVGSAVDKHTCDLHIDTLEGVSIARLKSLFSPASTA